MNRQRFAFWSGDLTLLLTVLTLLGIGLVMVFSASSVEAAVTYHNAYYFFARQLMWAAIGLGLLFFLARFPYWNWARLALPLFGVTVLLLLLVLIPHVGRNINGSRRWLGVGPLVFQPSELSKFSVVLLFAATLSALKEEVHSLWKGLGLHLLMLGVVCALILKEPDLGTAIALAGTATVMFYVAGVPLKQLLVFGVVSVPTVLGLILTSTYRRQRFFAFLDPWKHPLGSGYHTIQGLYALGSGGLFGTGLGQSSLKYWYLPEAHTDFIFAILAEELGFIGGVAVILLFFLFAWRGYRIALLAPDSLSSLLAVGLTTMIVLQALINIGVVTAVMPVTGIPLPFISYGGSSLVFALAGIGILLNISRHSAGGGV